MRRRDFIKGLTWAAAGSALCGEAEAYPVGSKRILIPLGGAGVSYNPAAVTIFNSFTTPPTAARKKLINNWVNATQSIWSKLDCWWMPAAADSQAALINWVAPGTNNLAVAGAPVFTADRGYAGDGGTGRLTGPNPTVLAGKMQQNSANIGVWLNSNVSEDSGEIGGGALFIRARTSTNTISGRMNDGTTSSWFSSITDGRGHTVGSRAASGTYLPYKNGVAGSAVSIASTGLLNAALNVCSTNSTTSATAVVGAAHIGGALTGGDITTLYNATLAYMQGIGAA